MSLPSSIRLSHRTGIYISSLNHPIIYKAIMSLGVCVTRLPASSLNIDLSTLTYRALAIHQPPYLASLLHFSNVPRQLRSSTSQQLSIPRTKLNLGKRAFSVAAPIIWNELPTTLKYCESLASFRKNLKTYLFKIAFPP